MRKLAPLALSLTLVAAASFGGESRQVRQELDLTSGGRVSLDTFKGTVEVRTWSKPRVEVVAQIVGDPQGENQDEKVRLTSVRVHGTGQAVEIESDYSEANDTHDGLFGLLFGASSGTVPFVNYQISMPATASLEIDDHKSDIRISDLAGDLNINTHKGTVRVVNFGGGATIETHKGEVHVDFVRFSRPSHFETHKGLIDLRIPAASRLDFDGDMGHGSDFRSDFAIPARGGEDGQRMSGKVNGGGPALSVESYKGTVRLVRK